MYILISLFGRKIGRLTASSFSLPFEVFYKVSCSMDLVAKRFKGKLTS